MCVPVCVCVCQGERCSLITPSILVVNLIYKKKPIVRVNLYKRKSKALELKQRNYELSVLLKLISYKGKFGRSGMMENWFIRDQ